MNSRLEKCLLQAARDSILHWCANKTYIPKNKLVLIDDLTLNEPSGVFVTLNKRGKLRGCMGSINSDRPLLEQVIIHSVNAAFKDTRFQPVEHKEIGLLNIEISILSKPVPVASTTDIDVNKHGIILTKNNKRAVFLPKVARSNNWSLKTTLTNLCKKAGLKKNDWKHGAGCYVFESTELKT